MEKQTSSPESSTISGKSPTHQHLISTSINGEIEHSLFNNLDIDYFVKTIAGIKAKGVPSDLIGSIITHYAATWLPDLTGKPSNSDENSPESVTSFVMKKRFFIETLIGIIPPEKDSVSCNFLLRLLRTANMIGVDSIYKSELESRISWQLDQASLMELMIPSFSHTCGTLLDIELVTRLGKKFSKLDNEGVKSGDSVVKVAKLLDSYMAEAAIDNDFSVTEFINLAETLPSHARVTDDGLYRAIDTYFKAHPEMSKQEKKRLWRVLNIKKLSIEASIHAAQNDRLPVRSILQVLFTQQTKLSQFRQQSDWNGSSFSGSRSPIPSGSRYSEINDPTRCLSKREVMSSQEVEIRRLKEDLEKLRSEFGGLKMQLMEKKCNNGGSKGLFKWRKIGFMKVIKTSVDVNVVEKVKGEEEEEFGFEIQTPYNVKIKKTPRWRKSMS